MVTLRRVVAACLLLLGLAVPALADPPIPALTGRVVDLAQVLDQPTIDALTRQLADHEAATSNQVVVVILSSLKDYTIEQWGRALLNGWGIGQRDKNNGVVLVVAPLERRLRIEVGYGLEDKLSNNAAADIIQNEIVPRFKNGDLKGGITAGVNAILATIAGTYRAPTLLERSSSSGSVQRDFAPYIPFVLFPLFFIAVVAIIIRGGSTNRRRYYDDGPYYGNNRYGRDRDDWGSRSSGFSSGGSSGGGGFSGGGGSGGGGGASGRW